MVNSNLPKDPHQKAHQIFQSFRSVQQVFFQMFTKIAEGLDLTPVQMMVMRYLHENPGLCLSDLAKNMSITSSTMSGIVDRMVKANLIVRERLESDRRTIKLSLTTYGEELWQQTNDARLQLLEPISNLPEEDILHLLHTHEKIIELLQQIREETE